MPNKNDERCTPKDMFGMKAVAIFATANKTHSTLSILIQNIRMPIIAYMTELNPTLPLKDAKVAGTDNK